MRRREVSFEFAGRTQMEITGSNVERSTSENLPAEGLEPTRPCGHWILSPARLPVPPRRQLSIDVEFIRKMRDRQKNGVDVMLTV
jgi:hypothetical protein